MQPGEFGLPGKTRGRLVVLALTVVCVIAVAVVLTLTLRLDTESDNFKRTFIAKCEELQEGQDCQKIWEAFRQAYVGKDPCAVTTEAYDPFVAAVAFKPQCNRMMFWSQTKEVVHDFTEKRECFVTIAETLLGYMVDGLTWCGKEGSDETFTSGCPGWMDCENSTVRSFWGRASATYAAAACGNVTAMLNGSIPVPFSLLSFFGSVEVKRLNSTRVRSLNIALVAQENFVANCTNECFGDLRKELEEGIRYSCEEVAEAQMQECSSDPEAPCGTCLKSRFH